MVYKIRSYTLLQYYKIYYNITRVISKITKHSSRQACFGPIGQRARLTSDTVA